MPGTSTAVGGALQRLAEVATRLAPPAPGVALLASTRARIARELLERRGGDIERAHALYGRDREAGREAIGRIAGDLVRDLRGAVAARSRSWTPGGIAARMDAVLPSAEMEYMDDPGLPEGRRTAGVRYLDRLNRVLGSYVRFLDALGPLLDGGPATVLDIASGHCGFAIALAHLSRARGLGLRVIASDLRPEYLEMGRRRAAAEGLDVEFRVADAFRLDREFAPGEIDVVTCTQTLHHFGPALAAGLVAESLRMASRGILFVDGVRSVTSVIALGAVTWLLSLDGAFVHDATLSIRASFVPDELRLVACCAPGGEDLEILELPPGFTGLRSRVRAPGDSRRPVRTSRI